MATSPGVFTLVHGNRLERLAQDLAQRLSEPHQDPTLRPDLVVVPHPGMARWLKLWLTQRLGVCANIEFPLPASFAWRVLNEAFGPLPPQSGYEPGTLVWRILSALPKVLQQSQLSEVDAYFNKDPHNNRSHGLRWYELAARLAQLYDHYLVYRRDWISAWEQGKYLGLGSFELLQAKLWRELREDIKQPHRGVLLEQWFSLCDGLDEYGDRSVLPQRIYCFGVSQLAPVYLDLLRSLGAIRRVTLYQLNPSLHYWADLFSQRELARLKTLWSKYNRSGGEQYHEVGHPLLASWGKSGRELLRRLHTGDQQEERDAFDIPDSRSLLTQLQKSIVLIAPEECAGLPALEDSSLRIHACPSRLREVEVLHDALLAKFQEDASLKPSDVVVMVPNINDYADYVTAIFASASLRQRIPYRIADRSYLQHSRLVDTFRRLLELPDWRFTATEVLDLLTLPSLRKRFEITSAELEVLTHWVSDSGIRWGLDAAFRQSLGLGEYNDYSWQFGLQRLLVGYACGEGVAQWRGVAPFTDLEGQAVRALGKLNRLLEKLTALRHTLQTEKSMADWVQHMHTLCDDFFSPTASDTEALDVLDELRRVIVALGAAANQAQYNDALPLPYLRAAFESELQQSSLSSQFPGEGVTVCTLLPMRAIPFRVVAVLGLNTGEFPGPVSRDSCNLMQAHPRAGDRSRPDDERFLFLETLLCARQALHLSYVACDLQDGKQRPPSILLDELLEFLSAQCFGGDIDRAHQCLVRRHRLYPFAPDYFSGLARERSFAAHWLTAARSKPNRDGGRRFVEGWPKLTPPSEVSLSDLIRFFRNPAKTQLRERLGIEFPKESTDIIDNEPFILSGLERYRACDAMLDLAVKDELHERMPESLRGSGLFPAAAAGDRLYQLERDSVLALAEVLRPHAPLKGSMRAITLDLAGVRLCASVELLPGGLLFYRAGELRAGDLLEAWLKHLLQALLEIKQQPRFVFGLTGVVPQKQVFAVVDASLARQALTELVALYLQSYVQPLPLFPRSQLAYVRAEQRIARNAKGVLPMVAAENAWNGEHSRGERADPYAALLARGQEPLVDEEFIRHARLLFSPLLAASL